MRDNGKTKKERTGKPCGKREYGDNSEDHRIDDVICPRLVKLGVEIIKEANRKGMCPLRVAERLSVNLNLFMATIVETLSSEGSGKRTAKSKGK